MVLLASGCDSNNSNAGSKPLATELDDVCRPKKGLGGIQLAAEAALRGDTCRSKKGLGDIQLVAEAALRGDTNALCALAQHPDLPTCKPALQVSIPPTNHNPSDQSQPLWRNIQHPPTNHSPCKGISNTLRPITAPLKQYPTLSFNHILCFYLSAQCS
jgi:hypothetical protein